MKIGNVDGNCFAVQYSPFIPSKIACVASQNFGLSGKGFVYIFENQRNNLVVNRRLVYESGLYDVAWSEFNEGIITTVANNGCIQIWNIFEAQPLVSSFQGHECEVSSVAWNLARDKSLFVTGSWDCKIKLWDPCEHDALLTLSDHSGIIYGLSWSPHLPATVLSCSGDGNARAWDVRAGHSTSVIPSGSGEVLSCDWTKYDPMIFVTSGTDSKLKIWDLRKCSLPIQILIGHEYPARRVKASPHDQGIVVSVSYDKTTRIWNYLKCNTPVANIKQHSEFVTGIDFNLKHEREVTDCSWDKTLKVFASI